MGLEKTEIWIAATHKIGSSVEDGLETAKTERAKLTGIAPALGQASKLVEDLCQSVNRDLDENKIPLDEPLRVAAYVKKYILLAKDILDQASKRTENARLLAEGRVQALEVAVKNIKRMHDSEIDKLRSLKQSLDAEAEGARPEGKHPGPSLKEQRLAEDKPKRRRKRPTSKRPPKTAD